MSRGSTALVAVLTAWLLAACAKSGVSGAPPAGGGSSPGAAAIGGVLDACAVLTAADVQTVMGGQAPTTDANDRDTGVYAYAALRLHAARPECQAGERVHAPGPLLSWRSHAEAMNQTPTSAHQMGGVNP